MQHIFHLTLSHALPPCLILIHYLLNEVFIKKLSYKISVQEINIAFPRALFGQKRHRRARNSEGRSGGYELPGGVGS